MALKCEMQLTENNSYKFFKLMKTDRANVYQPKFSPRKTEELRVNVNEEDVLKFKLKISQEQSSGTKFISILK